VCRGILQVTTRARVPSAPTAASCSCARSVRRARRSQCGVPQLALRAYSDDQPGGLRWHPSQVCRMWLPPQNLSSPSQSLYMDMGMVMMLKKEDPERGRDGREHGEHKRDKGRRCSHLVRPLGNRKRDMLRLHPSSESRSLRAPGPRPTSPRLPRRVALAENATRVFASSQRLA
jgi:hypothetical protein